MGQLFHFHLAGWIQLAAKCHSRRSFLLPRNLVWSNQIFSSRQQGPFVSTIPDDCIRASVRVLDFPRDDIHRCKVILENTETPGSSLSKPEESHRTLMALWQEYRDHVSGASGWVAELIKIQGDEQRLLDALLEGSLCIICDGSFSAGIGTACAQLCTESGDDVIWVTCRTPGLTKDQCSPRSELVGIMAAFLVLEWLCQLVGPSALRSRPLVEVGCDGVCALQKSFSWRTLKSSASHFDVVSTIQELLRVLPVRIQPCYVRGHADKVRSHTALSWWERCNLEVDQRAQAYHQRISASQAGPASNLRFFHEPATLFVHEVKLSCLDTAYILDLVSIDAWTAYWASKGRLTSLNREQVDWRALGRAMHLFPTLVKHTVGMCGVGKFRSMWRRGTNGACPCCSECEIEDHQHVPARCRGPTATSTWNKYHLLLRTWMVANSTAPEVEQFIFEYLCLLRSPTRPVLCIVTVPARTPLLKQAIASQVLIGVQGLLEGLLSSRWRRVQKAYFDEIGSPRSVDLWASRLIQQLILLGHCMWKNRNMVLHSDQNSHYLPCHREVDLSTITEQYRMGPAELPVSVHHLLRELKQKVLQRSLEHHKNWLGVVSPARMTEQRSLVRQRRMIYQLLHQSTSSSQ